MYRFMSPLRFRYLSNYEQTFTLLMTTINSLLVGVVISLDWTKLDEDSSFLEIS